MGCNEDMKTLTILAALWMAAFSSAAAQSSWRELSAQFFTNATVIWRATNEDLPKNLWIYRTTGPRIFPQTTISNAIVLGDLKNRGIPASSTNDTCIYDECHCSCAIHCLFSINPQYGSISFYSPLQTDSTQHLPDDNQIIQWAWSYSRQLDIDSRQIVKKNLTSHFNTDTNGNPILNQISGRGVYLSRVLDGIPFSGKGTDGSEEGFWIEFGSYNTIRAFCLIWLELKRDHQSEIASTQQMIRCIRANKAMLMPEDEEDYFTKLALLSHAKTVTVTKLTPYYCQGIFDDESKNAPSEFVTPFAELEAIANLEKTNLPVRIVCPITLSDINRLLKK